MPDATVTCDRGRARLHELIARPGVHVLLQRDAADVQADGRLVHVHRLADVPGRGLLVVRPDGYVGFRSGAVDNAQLRRWLACIGAAV